MRGEVITLDLETTDAFSAIDAGVVVWSQDVNGVQIAPNKFFVQDYCPEVMP